MGRPVSRGARAAAALALLALSLLPSCSRGPRSGRVILLGLDGMDPRVIELLMSEGKMPSFAKLRRDGAHGRLLSQKPLLSPVVWTTIATGKTPDQHGIGHFVAIDDKTGESLPVTSDMRRVRAVWDILSDAKKKVAMVGYWATWPAPKVNGAVVSDHLCYHFLFQQGATGDNTGAGLTHPPELLARIQPLVRRPSDITPAEAAAFVDVLPAELGRPFEFQDDLSHFKWALATAETHKSIGLRLWREDRPDLLMVYVEGTDSVSHLFGHLFRARDVSGELLTQQRRFGQAVEQMYLYADRLVGEFVEAMDSDTTLVVISDHGFELGVAQDDPSKTRDMRRVSERFHHVEGIGYLYGNRVKRARLDAPKTLDVTPTLLALLGLPPARDMPGRVLTEALDLQVPGPAVATYETGGGPGRGPARDAEANPEILERLKSLGYVGGSPDATTPPGQMRSPQGERNLAAVAFESGRYQEAADAYARLIRSDPKDAALRTSLAGCLGALGRYDEALRELAVAVKLEPLNVEAYHNRAVILERQGKKNAAVAEYRTAMRYRPDYEPSRRALVRLTGSADARAPQSPGEKQAAAFAEQAAAAAKRGDYPEAMKRLDEAERIAPRYALVHQYRSNVAYLMSDLPRAVQALERALELEPDNALFKNNLKRLQEQKATRSK